MSTQPMNQNPQANLELKIRTMRMVWVSMLFSLAGLFVLTIFQKRSEDVTPNPTLSLILLLAGASTTLISFLIRSRLLSRAVDQQQVTLVQQAYIVGWAVNEMTALLGVIDFFVTGHRHYYILLIISALGLLLQFPRREPVVNAAFKGSGFIAGAILLLVSSPMVSPQQKQEPAHKLVEFHMALLKHGPKWTATESEETKRLHQAHVSYVLSTLESGKAIIAGPLTDGGEIDGVYVFRAKSADEAKAWAEADPSVASGFRIAEMHPWWSEDIFSKPSKPLKLTKTYLAFLTRGEKWTAEKTPATEEIQKGHMANINRLAEMKKLIAAGPFGDDGRLRGIFVFRVESLEEAKSLTAGDPAVQAGRLAMDIHTWMVPDGILP